MLFVMCHSCKIRGHVKMKSQHAPFSGVIAKGQSKNLNLFSLRFHLLTFLHFTWAGSACSILFPFSRAK